MKLQQGSTEIKDGKIILHVSTIVFSGKAFIPRKGDDPNGTDNPGQINQR
ncbi:hypothetical protein [Limosilactobacillus sp.]|jgi:hypothetical protein|nr:hypothetical protein [Limosilactobacillus sp.]MCH3922357.1 hypothetical protein [Limosilactobacillus sp.]MCH3929129.1 hypothetical protein [Limosilactobacillus sp.]